MGYRYIITICLALAATAASAQTFLDNLRSTEAGRGTVTVTESAAVDSLVNGTKPLFPEKSDGKITAARTTASTAQNTPPTGAITPHVTTLAPAGSSGNTGTATLGTSGTSANTNPSTAHHPTVTPSAAKPDGDDAVLDNKKKVMKNGHKVQGYRIQVYSGGNSREDKQKAEAAGNAMKAKFPTEPVYVHFYSPSWKCRIGNYKTVEEARAVLAQVKKSGFGQACIVKGTISVAY